LSKGPNYKTKKRIKKKKRCCRHAAASSLCDALMPCDDP